MSEVILSRNGLFRDNLRGVFFHSKELREKVIKCEISRENLLSLCNYHVGCNGLESLTDGQLVDLLEEVAENYQNS